MAYGRLSSNKITYELKCKNITIKDNKGDIKCTMYFKNKSLAENYFKKNIGGFVYKIIKIWNYNTWHYKIQTEEGFEFFRLSEDNDFNLRVSKIIITKHKIWKSIMLLPEDDILHELIIDDFHKRRANVKANKEMI